MKDKDTSSRRRSTGSNGARTAEPTALAPIEARFQAVFENSRDAIGFLKAGVHVFVNPAYLELFGFSPGTNLAGTSVQDLIAPVRCDEIKEHLLCRVRGESAPATFETRGLRADGSEFDMEVKVSPYQENGDDHTLVILRDITPREIAEREIAERDAMLQQIMDTASMAIGLVDKTGRITHANRRMAEMFGGTLEELVGGEYVELVHPSERDTGRKQMLALLASETSAVDLERRYVRKDGTEFWGHLDCRRFHDAQGSEIGLIGVITDISRHRQAEDLLKVSEDKYKFLVETTNTGFVILGSDGLVLDANTTYARLSGHEKPEEILGRSVMEWTAAHDKERNAAEVKKCIEQGFVRDLAVDYVRKDGGFTPVEINATVLRAGTEVKLFTLCRDITVRRQSELVLKQREEKYRRLYNETPVLLHSIDRNGILIDVNDYWLKILGYERSEVIGRKATAFYTAESRKYAEEVAQPAFFRDGNVKDISFQFVKKNGSVVDVLLSATAERDADGTVTRSLAVIVDITDRKRVEDLLRRSEARYRMLYQGTPVMMHSIDAAGSLISVSDQWLQRLGYTRDEVLGRRSTEFLDEQSREYARTVVLPDFMRTGICTDVPYTFLKKTGESISTLLSAIAERDEAGKIVRSLAVIIDITERKAAAEALRENQARLELALQSAHMGVWRWEIKENRRYFDELTCQLLGIEATRFTGGAEEFLQTVHPEDREKIKAALARTLGQDAPYEPTYRVVWPNGNVHNITSRGRLVRDAQGQPARINGILWDITDQRLLEQERIKSQKLESVGTLAGGIAHDFNNLLQGIFGYISMARLTHDQKEKSLAMLEQAEKALQQSVNLTSQLLTFSKGGKPAKKVADLRPVIGNAAALALSGSRNTCEIVADEDLRAVEADEGQIGQVIRNIVLNADQAMPLGGVIRVAARNTAAAAIVPPTDLQGDLVEISIRDQGTGIPVEHLARIFDPYFTTKEKGSGLGLATSYSIIKNHGGLVRVQSEVGKGTAFFIYLPASAAQSEEADRSATAAATRKGRILVMDDEEMIRRVAAELLAAIGHEVASAETGETALAAYRAARDAGRPFDVVILDLTIRGGMGGIETLRKLVEIDPAVKAVVSSGYSDDAALSNYREQGFQAFLKKPYRMEELQSLLSALLA